MNEYSVLESTPKEELVASNPLFNQDLFEQFLAFIKMQNHCDVHSVAGAFVKSKKSGIHYSFHSKSVTSGTRILDTGVTDHICCDMSLFTSVPASSSIKINLPNNHLVVTTYIGNIKLNEHITLYNVPDFSFNLLSISHPTRYSNVSMVFDDSLCALQENNTKRVTDFVEQRGVLYLMKHEKFVNNASASLVFYASFKI